MIDHPVVNNQLLIGGVKATDLIEQFGSPLYVYDAAIIRERYESLMKVIDYPQVRIHYAMKANSNQRILEVLEKEGAYLDTVSAFEVEIALRAGFEADRILFTAINLTDEDMRYAKEQGIVLNVGSLDTLARYGELYPGSEISIRINPDYGAGHHDHTNTGGPASKFGIFQSNLAQARDIIKKHGLKLMGLHSHIGSGILDQSQYVAMMDFILQIARDFPGLEFINFGGGIGVPYRPDQPLFDLDAFGQRVSRLMKDFSKAYGKEITLALEPGRYLIADAGVLLCRVTDLKSTPQYRFVGVDTGFNHLIRPMAYGSYHHIVNASHVQGEEEDILLAGYLCESGDIFTRNEQGLETRRLSRPRLGDVIALYTAGAYGYVMASRYNSRPLPAEVLIDNEQPRLIRRREKLEDILASQL